MKILLIEDDPEIAAGLLHNLAQHGYCVAHATNGKDGLFLAVTEKYDVHVIDLLLPEMCGLEVILALRAAGVKTPALIMTALGTVAQRVEGLEAGGDDYLVKPFAFSELLARIKALVRRSSHSLATTFLDCSGLRVDRLGRRVAFQNTEIDLQPREFLLLETLLLHKGEVLTRAMLLEKVWDFHFDPRTNIVETHISRLRSKIGPAKDMIQTVRGMGYVIREVPL
jgi:two-component system OmpR family response regulator